MRPNPLRLMTTPEFLDELKVRHQLKNDSAAARALGITQASVSNLRARKNTFDDTTAVRVAELLDLDPAYVIACAHAQGARRPEVRHVWERLARAAVATVAGLVLAAGLVLSPSPATADNASSVYYVKRRLRHWVRRLALILALTGAPAMASEAPGILAHQALWADLLPAPATFERPTIQPGGEAPASLTTTFLLLGPDQHVAPAIRTALDGAEAALLAVVATQPPRRPYYGGVVLRVMLGRSGRPERVVIVDAHPAVETLAAPLAAAVERLDFFPAGRSTVLLFIDVGGM